MKISSPPYLRPFSERVQVKQWLCVKNNMLIPLPEVMPEWDTAVNIKVSIKAEVDTLGILEDCKLPAGCHLRLISTWESTGTGLRGCGSFVDIDTMLPNQCVDLDLEGEGGLLAGELIVGVSLILTAPTSTEVRAAPKLPGSLLWRDVRKITLEGIGTRFPVEVVFCPKTFLTPKSSNTSLRSLKAQVGVGLFLMVCISSSNEAGSANNHPVRPWSQSHLRWYAQLE